MLDAHDSQITPAPYRRQENQHLRTTESSTGWRNPPPTMPSDTQIIQSLEEIRRSDTAHTAKSPSHWRNQTAEQPLAQPNHPVTGRKHPPSNPAHDQIIQLLEKSVRLTSSQTTKPSTRWRNQHAQQPITQPNHPATGEIGTLSDPSHNQIIQPPEKSVRLTASQTTKSPSQWRNQHAEHSLIRPKHPPTGKIGTLNNPSHDQITQLLEESVR